MLLGSKDNAALASELRNAKSQKKQWRRKFQEKCKKQIGGSGHDVGDGECSRWQATRARTGKQAKPEFEEGSGKLVDDQCTGLSQRKSQQRNNESQQPVTFRTDGVLERHYAPARNDWDAWECVARKTPERLPAIERDVCRVVNGLADRTHRLRAIGNGCDPLCAAVAFVSLFANLWEGMNNENDAEVE